MKLFSLQDVPVDLKQLRRYLVYACGLALFLIPVEIWKAASYSRISEKTLAESQDDGPRAATATEPLDSYNSNFQTSPLFGYQPVQASAPVQQTALSDLIRDFRLKGVMLSGEPEALVEDAKNQKTLFLKTGDPLGEVRVKAIEEGRIILEYHGEEQALKIES